MLSKVQAILQHGSHPLNNALVKKRSTFSQRLIAPRCNTECHRKSVAIKLYNSSLWWSDFYIKKQNKSTEWNKTKKKQNCNVKIQSFLCSVYIISLNILLYIFPDCLLYYLIFYFIVYFMLFYYCLLNILFISLSLFLIWIMLYFYFSFARSACNKNNSPPGINKGFWFWFFVKITFWNV